MDRICIACGTKREENKYLKHRTICKKGHNKNRRKSNNTLIQNETSASHQQPKVDNDNNHNKNNVPEKQKQNNTPNLSTYENNRHKTYYKFEILEKKGNQRLIHIITRSPFQYSNFETSNEIKPINKYKGSVVLFDDMFGAGNCSLKDEFFYKRQA